MRRAACRGRRGFFLMDMMIGMSVALLLLVTMAVAVAQQHQAQRRLADTRAAMRQLEAAALGMQNGGTPEKGVAVERLREESGRRVWVRLSVQDAGGKGRSLVALVPANAAGRAP
jgi:hypothetical protein